MIIYVDDVFIMHRDIDEHLEFLGKLFDKFREYNLHLHPKKDEYCHDHGKFIGFHLASRRIHSGQILL